MNHFLRRYVYKHSLFFFIGILFLICSNYFLILIPLKLKAIVNHFTNTPVHASNGSLFLGKMIVMILLLSLLMFFVRVLSRVFLFYPGRQIEYEIKRDFYKQLLRKSPSFYRKQSLGHFISILVDDSKKIRLMFSLGTLHIVNSFLIFFFVNYQIFQIDPKLMCLLSIPTPILLYLSFYCYHRMNFAVEENQKRLEKLTNVISASFKNILLTKTFSAEKSLKTPFDRRNKLYSQGIIDIARMRSYVFPIIGLVGSLGQVTLLFWGGRTVIRETMSLGEFIAVSTYLNILIWPIIAFAWIFSLIQNGKVSLNRYLRYWQDFSFEKTERQPSVLKDSRSRGLRVDVRDLSFCLEKKPFFKNLSFSVDRGETLGICGAMGEGKTLLLNLLTGIETFSSGSIDIEGIPLEKSLQRGFYSQISYVPQKTFLFSQEIFYNIAYSDMEREEISFARVKEMARLAFMDEEIETFPNGYRSVIGDKGLQLSMGQKNRVALARSFYKDYQFLLVDDIFSALDAKTTLQVLKNLLQHNPSATKIFASHKTAVLSQCDRLIVLDRGQIAEEGKASDLIGKGGLYAKIFSNQKEFLS